MARLLLEYHGFVSRQARRFVAFADLAEDVVQQVFVELLRRPDHWDASVDLRPVLTVVTRRTAQAVWKERTRLLPDSLHRIAEYVQAELSRDEYEPDDRIEALRDCLSKLPAGGRELIEHYYFDGVSTETLAERLQKKPNTVAKAIFRLRERLRICIERAIDGEPDHGT